jgi:hypothetical protein
VARFTSKVLRLLSEELTGTVLRQIDALFSDNEVPLGPPQPDENDPGERRERMRRYLASLNFDNPSDHAKLMGVYSDLLQDIARRKNEYGFDAGAYRDRWVQTLEAAGFEVDPWSYVVSDPSRPTTLGLTADALAALTDPSAILDHLARLGDTVQTDPRLAVSTAKALIESTAKSVLTARGLPYTKSDKVPALVNRAQQSLALSAKGVSDEVPRSPSGPPVSGDSRPRSHRDSQPDRCRPRRGKRAGMGTTSTREAGRRRCPGLVSADVGDLGGP